MILPFSKVSILRSNVANSAETIHLLDSFSLQMETNKIRPIVIPCKGGIGVKLTKTWDWCRLPWQILPYHRIDKEKWRKLSFPLKIYQHLILLCLFILLFVYRTSPSLFVSNSILHKCIYWPTGLAMSNRLQMFFDGRHILFNSR